MASQSQPFAALRWRWLAGSLLMLFVLGGCNPGAITMLLLPFSDDKIPAKCKLSKKREETTVVVYATFAKGDLPLDLEPAARELSDALSVQLRKRFTANKEKVIVVNPSKVRSFTNGRFGQPFDAQEIGEHFKADYVIHLEIGSLALYEPKSRMLYRGHTEINVTVTDVKEEEGENRILTEVYHTSYPSAGPIEAGSSSPREFRALFLNKISVDLSRWFAAYPKDERKDMDPF